jgi:AmmeMemoRadiSam system protein B
MYENPPAVRIDLEFIPVNQAGQQLILVRDHLGLVPEGKAISPPLYHFMSLLASGGSLRDLQLELMRQKGGVLVGSDEVKNLIAQLDESFLLDSERYKTALEKIVADFASLKTRPCVHCGQSYPDNSLELKNRLEEILSAVPPPEKKGQNIVALVAPHIDLAVGFRVYAAAYQRLSLVKPSRIVLLGVGHRMSKALFSVTDKDFETPLGTTPCEKSLVRILREEGGPTVADNDFAHRSEHSIEFQILFLQHILPKGSFTMIPILCGSLLEGLSQYTRSAYIEKAGPFLDKLREIIQDPEQETLLIAGVDLSHIGLKFGHERPASYLEKETEKHDRNLLQHVSHGDADLFWQESQRVEDRFHVCGFSALACLLEVLSGRKGDILDYQLWHEEATKSAVSFSALIFTTPSEEIHKNQKS